MTPEIVAAVSFAFGLTVGLGLGIVLAPHLPRLVLQGVSHMRTWVNQHAGLLIVLLLFTTLLTGSSFVAYQQCVASYVHDAGVSQAPRAVASVEVQDALHIALLKARRLGGDSPEAVAALDIYLGKFHTYAHIVATHPTPHLSWCLRG